MNTRPRRRIAWIASAAAHLLLLAGFWRFGEGRAARVAPDVPAVAESEERPLVLAEARDEPAAVAVTVPAPPAPVPPAALAAAVPHVEMVPKPPDVIDVVGDLKRARFDSSWSPAPPIPVRPAEYPLTPVAPPAPPRFAGGKVLHGALPAGRRAVYLLDRSASMGLVRDTFEAARAALFTTAGGTPAGGSFQVLAYNSDVIPLLGGARGAWLTMTGDGTTAKLRTALATLEPEGRSRHDAALRAALAQEADYVIWTTDADDAELAALKPILKSARKPVAVYLCRAGAGKVAAPAEWK